MQEEPAVEAVEQHAPAPDIAPGGNGGAAGMGGVAGEMLTLQTTAGNRAAAAALAAGTPGLPADGGPGSRSLARAVQMLARAPAKPPKIGPAATIPERDDAPERGYYSTTDKVTYAVRASGPGKETGLYVDHLFDTQAEAEEYASKLAATGEEAIRVNSALPRAWAPEKPGAMPVTGNPVTHVYVMKVPAGTPYIQSVVKEQAEHRKAPWLPKSYAGGGPQTVLSWEGKKEAVASFPVAKLPHPNAGAPIPPPPDWVYNIVKPAPPPPAVVASDNAHLTGSLHAPKIATEAANQRMLKDLALTGLDDINTYEKVCKLLGKPLPESEAKRREVLQAQADTAGAAMAQAYADLDLLKRPGASPKDIQEMLVRRGVGVPQSAQSFQSGAAELKGSGISGWGLSDKGFSKSQTTGSTRTVIGPDGKPMAITTEDTSGAVIGFSGIGTNKGGKVTTFDGTTTKTSDQTKSRVFNPLTGEFTWTDNKSSESKSATASGKSVDNKNIVLGPGGLMVNKEKSETADGVTYGTKTSKGLDIGGGKAGYKSSTTKKEGTYDEEGKLTKGKETTRSGNVGIIADDKGNVGVGGGVSQDTKRAHGKGFTSTTTVAVDGRVTMNVEPWKDPDDKSENPAPKFRIMISIYLGGKLGAGGGWEGEANKEGAHAGNKANVGVSGSVSASYTATFGRVLTDEQAKHYIAAVKAGGKGNVPDHPEFRLIQAGTTQGWGAAYKLWQSMRGRSADEAAAMQVGDIEKTAEDLGAEGKVSLGGESGGLGIGIEYGKSVKGSLEIVKEPLKGNLLKLTVTVKSEESTTKGGSVSFGGAGGGVSLEDGTSKGKAVVFVLSTTADNFKARYNRITQARSTDELQKLAAQYSDAVEETTDSKGTSSGENIKLSAGPVTLGIGGKGKVDEDITRDKQGNITKWKYTGENTASGSIGAGPVTYSDSLTETYSAETDKEGKVNADLSKTKKSTSVGKTIIAAGEAIEKGQWSALLNPGSVVKQDVESEGLIHHEDDIDRVAAEASDKKGWDNRVASPSKMPEWKATGAKIRNAPRGPDGKLTPEGKAQVTKALADWTGNKAGGRADTVDAILRPAGTEQATAAQTSFPEGTEGLKDTFDTLIVRDGLAEARAIVAEAEKSKDKGKYKQGLDAIDAVKSKMQSLNNSLSTAAGIKGVAAPLAFNEMMSRITKRLNEAEQIARICRVALAPPKPAPPPGTPPPDPAEEAKREAAQKKLDERNAAVPAYNNNLDQIRRYRDNVQAGVGQAEAELNKISLLRDWNKACKLLKDAEFQLKSWDALYWQMFGQMEKHGFDRGVLEQYHPAGSQGYWKRVDAKTR